MIDQDYKKDGERAIRRHFRNVDGYKRDHLRRTFSSAQMVTEKREDSGLYVIRMPDAYSAIPGRMPDGSFGVSLFPIQAEGETPERSLVQLYDELYYSTDFGPTPDRKLIIRALFFHHRRPQRRNHTIEAGRLYEDISAGPLGDHPRHDHNNPDHADFTFIAIPYQSNITQFTTFEEWHNHLDMKSP